MRRDPLHPLWQHDDDCEVVQWQQECHQRAARVRVGELVDEAVTQLVQLVRVAGQAAHGQRGHLVRPIRVVTAAVLILLGQAAHDSEDLVTRRAVELQHTDALERGKDELLHVHGRACEADQQLAWG